MSLSGPAQRPAWFDGLLADVDRAFEATGADTPGWADPHPDRNPPEDEYSRCLDAAKYRILDARIEAWAVTLTARGLATVEDVEALDVAADRWLDTPRRPEEVNRVRRLAPARADGLTLVVAKTLVGGAPFGLDLAVAGDGLPTAYLDTVPDCGCDACDSGSDDLLATLDGWVLTIARGGVVHARSAECSISLTLDGRKSSGARVGRLAAWLDASSPAPVGVARWIGAPWQQ